MHLLDRIRDFGLGLGLVALAACAADGSATSPTRGSGSSTSSGSPNSSGGPGASSGFGNPTNFDSPTALAGSSGGAAGSGKPTSDPNVCASADVSTSHATPNVYFVIDGSGSMDSKFGSSGTRWSVLRDSLIGTNGVVTKLQGAVKFGMAIYSNSDPNKCPAMTSVPAALNNLTAMTSAYPTTEPGGGTPTGEALQQVVDGLMNFNSPDLADGPPIIILATDGEPNGCSAAIACDWTDWANCLSMLLTQVSNAPATYDSTFAAVRAARMKNVPVWVISLADGLNSIPDLQKTANIGAGLADDAMPGATIYSPQNSDDLTQTLSNLIGQAVGCDVTLSGTLTVSRACEGSVLMNGEKLPCNDDQGWKAVDEHHIALQGAACDKFKNDPAAMLAARFPCDVVVVQ